MKILNTVKTEIFNEVSTQVSKNEDRLSVYNKMYQVCLNFCQKLDVEDGKWGFRSRYSNIFTVSHLDEFMRSLT